MPVAAGGNHRAMAELDQRLKGWIIAPKELDICTRADGSAWLLGSGTYGKVGVSAPAHFSARDPVPPGIQRNMDKTDGSWLKALACAASSSVQELTVADDRRGLCICSLH